MSMHTPKLDKKGLRNFGFTTGAIVAVLFGFLLPWIFDKSIPLWPWWIVMPLWILAAVMPGWLSPVYTGWMKIGHILGWINTRIILGVVFYFLIFPIGLLLTLFGKDSMQRKLDVREESYRVNKEKRTKVHVERPF